LGLQTGTSRPATVYPAAYSPPALQSIHTALADLDRPGQSGLEHGEGAVDTDSQQQGIAQTANDRTYSVMSAIGAEGEALLCECNRPSCSERITMTPSEYVGLRDRHEVIDAIGHDQPPAGL
jgi:hypothetical protein